MNLLMYLVTLPVIAALLPPQNSPAVPLSAYKAHLETRMQGDLLTIIGHCHNAGAQAVSLRYEIRTDKRGPSGTTSNAQSGSVTLPSQQDVALSQTTINVVPADFYRIKLRMLNEHGAVVAEDSLLHTTNSRP